LAYSLYWEFHSGEEFFISDVGLLSNLLMETGLLFLKTLGYVVHYTNVKLLVGLSMKQ
jgi:hypothetical protein